MKEFAALKNLKCATLIDDGSAEKKAKDTKKCVIRRNINFQDYKECLEKKTTLKFQQRFRIESHKVFTEKVNKIALSTNDNKNSRWCHLISIWRSPWNGVQLLELMKYSKI